MPTYTEIQAEVTGTLNSLLWASPETDDALIILEKAKDVIIHFAILIQQRLPDENGYEYLPRIIDATLNLFLTIYKQEVFPTIQDIEMEVTKILFSKFLVDLHARGEQGFGSTFFEIPTEGIASLIRQISYEIEQHGWSSSSSSTNFSLFTWIKDQPSMLRSHLLSDEEQKDLVNLGERLVDSAFLAIPDEPFFCRNNEGLWSIFDRDTITGMLKSNEDTRQKIADIERSGPSLDYILSHLPDNDSQTVQASDRVLSAWNRNFPMQTYSEVVTESDRQQILANHIEQLEKADEFLDGCVWECLPESVRQTVGLTTQKQEQEENLQIVTDLEVYDTGLKENRAQLLEERRTRMSLLNDKSTELESDLKQEQLIRVQAINERLKEIRAELQETQEQLDLYGSIEQILAEIHSLDVQLEGRMQINGQIDRARLLTDTLKRAKDKNDAGKRDGKPECRLLSSNVDDVDGHFMALVNQAVEALIERECNFLRLGQLGPLSQHYSARRNMQLELFDNAKIELCTQPTANGQLFTLTERLVRDPLVRTCFFNIDTATDGRDFCDIIIGGCLCAVKSNRAIGLPDKVTSFIDEQTLKDPFYSNKAILKFIEFRRGNLILPINQFDPHNQLNPLARYSLIPVREVRTGLLPCLSHFAPPRNSSTSSEEEEEYLGPNMQVTSV